MLSGGERLKKEKVREEMRLYCYSYENVVINV